MPFALDPYLRQLAVEIREDRQELKELNEIRAVRAERLAHAEAAFALRRRQLGYDSVLPAAYLAGLMTERDPVQSGLPFDGGKRMARILPEQRTSHRCVIQEVDSDEGVLTLLKAFLREKSRIRNDGVASTIRHSHIVSLTV